ncbi:DUF2752 domain-containing protein [Nocardia sp. NPDC057353]|uniref:DUF2752 domain-containing protein n=1 Tax=Nocardia sp. NPDC057353 TaxID=3346104 RepID=UPI003637FD8D
MTTATRSRLGVVAPLAVAGAGIGVAVLLHLRDPHVEGSYGICPVYALTGWYCPGCGGLRGTHLLTEGDVVGSLQSNFLVLPLVLAFVLWVADWTRRAWRGDAVRLPRLEKWMLWAFLGLLTVYTVLRNSPWGGWLAPV